MYADLADLEIVMQHLWGSHDLKVISQFLKIFSNRSLPSFDPRLIDLCEHGDSEVRRRAFNALQNNEHPLIRAFAFSRLGEDARDGAVICLFIRNFQSGDEKRILAFLERPDVEDRHWPLRDLIEILENVPKPILLAWHFSATRRLPAGCVGVSSSLAERW